MFLHLSQELLDPKSPGEDDKEESQLPILQWERKGEKVSVYKFLSLFCLYYRFFFFWFVVTIIFIHIEKDVYMCIIHYTYD